MGESVNGPDAELELQPFVRLQWEDGDIREDDRLRKHLPLTTNEWSGPRVKVFPSTRLGKPTLLAPEVEIPAFLRVSGNAAQPKSSGESSPTPSNVSYLEIARVHRQRWRSDASDS